MAAVKKTTARKAGAAEAEPDTTGAGSAKVADEQHPSLYGEPEVEIAKRSQDVDEKSSTEHRKVFVIPKNGLLTDDYTDEVHAAMHAANIDSMRQNMIHQGLRPTEDGRFVEAKDHSDGYSKNLVYACRCVPAAIATPEQSQVRVTVADQHALEDERAKAEATSPDTK